MYLIDTDVLSLTNPATGHSGAAVEAWRDWVQNNASLIHLSAVTLMEVRFGIEKLRHKGATKKVAAIEGWLAAAQSAYRSRILPVSPEVANRAGEMLWRATATGEAPSAEDAIVAATAAIAGFAVLSHNGRHMQALQVDWRDPLTNLPS